MCYMSECVGVWVRYEGCIVGLEGFDRIVYII